MTTSDYSPDFDGQGRFKNNVQYTAVMTITPAAGYSITADTSLSVVGATSVNINYGPDSVIVTAIFPLTAIRHFAPMPWKAISRSARTCAGSSP